MPSLISQMQNGQGQPQPQLNNDSIQQTKSLMSAMRMSANPQAYLLNMLNSNPYLANMVKTGGNLKNIAEQMAQVRGINLNELIQKLQT